MKAELLILCVIGLFIAHAAGVYAVDIPEAPALKDAIKKYYDTVDKAKLPYENELRRVLSNMQKAGNLKAYNAIEAELNHTIGKNGHCYTAFAPPQRTAMFSNKIALKRAVDNARQEFKETADKLASEYLKSGFVDLAREIDMLAKVVEPPRLNAAAGIQSFTIDWKEAPHMRHVITLTRPARGIYYAYWSSDNSKIVTSGADHFIVLWDAKTGRELADLKRTEKGRGLGVTFGTDGRTIFFSGNGGEVGRWDSQTKKLIWKVIENGGVMESIVISPDGKTLCTGGKDGVYVWSAETGRLLHVLKEHQGAVGKLAFFAQGERLATMSLDKTAIVWDTKTWTPIHRLHGHSKGGYGLAVTPDDKIIATGAGDTVILWNAQTGMPIQKLTGFGADILSLAFSPDGFKLALGRHGDGDGVVVLDTRTWKAIAFAPGHGPYDNQISWDSKGERLVTCGNDARIWTMPGK